MSIKFFKEPMDRDKMLGLYYKMVTQYIHMGKELRDAYEIENPQMREIAVEVMKRKMEEHAKDLATAFTAAKELGELDEEPEEKWADQIFEEDVLN